MEAEIAVLRKRGSEYEEVPDELRELVRSAYESALKAAGYCGEKRGASVLLTDDEGIAELHAQYLGEPCATDVMSFPFDGEERDEPEVLGGPGHAYLGDIVVSEETARAQAQEYGHSIEREIALLVTHGALHLIGYDDLHAESSRVMREMEKKALELLWPGGAGGGGKGQV